jgi:hypothetical protein
MPSLSSKKTGGCIDTLQKYLRNDLMIKEESSLSKRFYINKTEVKNYGAKR